MRYVVLSLLFFINFISTNDYIQLTFQGETIANVVREEFKLIVGQPFLNNEKFNQLTEKIDRLVLKDPINAKINKEGEIVPEKNGYKLNAQKFQEAFYDSFFNENVSSFEIPILPLQAKVDSELIANIHVKQISRYITYFNVKNKARSHNISLAVEAINNHVMFPGEVFSFNKVVGKRTSEKGYLPAPVIIKGKVYKDFGGGICQVSSTLFNAVDLAGIEIVERYSHSKRVPYVPPGRDATVSWYGPDFAFKNKLNQPILIRANTFGGILIINIFSSEAVNSKEN